MNDAIGQWRRGDSGFMERVHAPLFNRLPVGRSPDLVVEPRSEDDIEQALLSARRAGHRVCVRSGASNWLGASVRADGVLIDMGLFDRAAIDAEARVARVGPGLRSGTFGRLLAARGLAFPIGHCGAPAMGGYLLSGGLGLNWARWQPACFSIRSIRAITASGERVVANEQVNSDLLWMARGSGPGFPGVITEFELELQARPADTRVSSWHFPMQALDEVTRWVCEASEGMPSHVELAVTTTGPDPATLSPESGKPEPMVSVAAIAFVDSEAQARTALAPLSRGPRTRPLKQDVLAAIPFEELDRGAEAAHPAGHRVLADTFWSGRNVHTLLPPLSALLERAPSSKNSVVALMPGHGASKSGVPADAGAYSMDERTLVLAFATWDDAAADAVNHAWMAELTSALEAVSTGHFLGEADLTRHAERASRSFSKANWHRMDELRRKWDPDRLFHTYLSPPG